MRKAYTMIELILVVVIVGILASVAIPKLAASREDAHAILCELEVTRVATELGNFYTSLGHTVFISTKVSDMTNIRIVSKSKTADGIVDDTTVESGIEYQCDNIKIAKILYSYDLTIQKFGLSIELYEGQTPASSSAFEVLKEKLNINAANERHYIF